MHIKEVYLAGGCFWGVEAYFSHINGILDTISGYANGSTEDPTYEQVVHDNTGHAETVKIIYDSSIISLNTILRHYFRIIDPTSLNRQGNDIGTQYRTGIYTINEEDQQIAAVALNKLQKKIPITLVVENLPLKNFYLAEEYHQEYLEKNPAGYCHVDLSLINVPLEPEDD